MNGHRYGICGRDGWCAIDTAAKDTADEISVREICSQEGIGRDVGCFAVDLPLVGRVVAAINGCGDE